MSLECLPEEVLAIILKLLDFKSIYSLYNVGIPIIQSVIASGYIKNCDISLSTMATINMLKTNVFINISANLTNLDLKGVQDLTREALLPTMKRMKNLSTLNVAYTNITIVDFLHIYDQCPSIKNICIDYQFTNNEDADFSQELLLKCQEVFANMIKVHFVGSKPNLLESQLPGLILKKTSLDSLTYSMVKNNKNITYMSGNRYLDNEPIIFKNLNIFSLWQDGIRLHTFLNPWHPTPILKNVSQYEFIVVQGTKFKTVQCSHIFESFLVHKFGQKAKVKLELESNYDPVSPQACLLWDKRTTFDKNFFDNLLLKIAPLFPCKLYRDNNFEEDSDSDEDEPVLTSDWIWVKHGEPLRRVNPLSEKRTTQQIDIDMLLKDKQNVEFNVSFKTNVKIPGPGIPVIMTGVSKSIEKLTYLSIDRRANYSLQFFNVFFPHAKNLKTLNVEFQLLHEEQSCRDSLSQLLKYVSKSPALKNLRISARGLFDHFPTNGLCKCKTLENVYLADTSFNLVQDIGHPELLIEHCKNLYHLRIDAFLLDDYRTAKLEYLDEVKIIYNVPHLYFQLNSISKDHKCQYNRRYEFDPFVDVFKLNKIKILYM